MAWRLLNIGFPELKKNIIKSLEKKRESMLRLILLLIALLAFGETSRAQSDDAANNCTTAAERNDFDLAITNCTSAIQSGQLSDEELAIAFNNRGFAYYSKRDYDGAIRDYDR